VAPDALTSAVTWSMAGGAPLAPPDPSSSAGSRTPTPEPAVKGRPAAERGHRGRPRHRRAGDLRGRAVFRSGAWRLATAWNRPTARTGHEACCRTDSDYGERRTASAACITQSTWTSTNTIIPTSTKPSSVC